MAFQQKKKQIIAGILTFHASTLDELQGNINDQLAQMADVLIIDVRIAPMMNAEEGWFGYIIYKEEA